MSTELEEFFERQRGRLAWMEQEDRGPIEESEWTTRGELGVQFSAERQQVTQSSVWRAVEDDEKALVARQAAAFGQLRAQWAAIQLAVMASSDRASSVSEASVRRAIHNDADIDLSRLEREWTAGSAALEQLGIDGEERHWRNEIVKYEASEWNSIWHAQIAPTLRYYLVSARGTHSEPNYRRYIEISERRKRLKLAVLFCELNVEWVEQWGRLTLRVLQKLMADCLRGQERIGRQEVEERAELRQIFMPGHINIIEELDFRNERFARRQAKIDALKRLREFEVDKLRQRALERTDYVRFWKQDELKKISMVQEQIVQQVAMHYPTTDGDTSENPWGRIAYDFSNELERMSRAQDQIPFADLAQYRQRLQEFDEFAAKVEMEAAANITAADEGPLPLAATLSMSQADNDTGRDLLEMLHAKRSERKMPESSPLVTLAPTASTSPQRTDGFVRPPVPPAEVQIPSIGEAAEWIRPGDASQNEVVAGTAAVHEALREAESIAASRIRVSASIAEMEGLKSFEERISAFQSWVDQNIV